MFQTKKIIKGILITSLFLFTFISSGIPFINSSQTAENRTFYSETESREWTAIPTAHAADLYELTQKDIQGYIKTASIVHNVFYPLIHFFALNIGNFMGTDHIYNGAMGTMLHNLWTTIRNIVNILFVFILLFIALKELFGFGESNLKQNLVKFTLLLVAVNFTWLATKVILDAANVMTNVAFSIPAAANKMEMKPCEVRTKEELKGMCGPTHIYLDAEHLQEVYYIDNKTCESDDFKAKLKNCSFQPLMGQNHPARKKRQLLIKKVEYILVNQERKRKIVLIICITPIQKK